METFQRSVRCMVPAVLLCAAVVFALPAALFAQSAPTAPATPKPAAKPVIAVIPKGTTHEFWKTVEAGARQGAADAGVEVVWKGPAREDDRDEQIKVVEAMLARGVAGIVIAPLDQSALVPVLKQAAAQKVPVVVFDSGLKWDGQKAFVATDNLKGGQMAAREMGRLLNGKGTVIMMRYVEGSASTAQREDGFLQTLKSEFPGITVASSSQYGGATVDSAYRVAENLLTKHPDIQGVYAPNEPTTYAFMKALKDAGRKKGVAFVGFDASQKLVQGLRDGQVDALVVQNPWRMGQLAVTTMASVLEGKSVPAFVDTGVVLATPQNMEQPDVQQVLNPPVQKATPPDAQQDAQQDAQRGAHSPAQK